MFTGIALIRSVIILTLAILSGLPTMQALAQDDIRSPATRSQTGRRYTDSIGFFRGDTIRLSRQFIDPGSLNVSFRPQITFDPQADHPH